MAKLKLDAKNVERLLPEDGVSGYVWDEAPHAPRGFGLRVSAQSRDAKKATRTYVLAYRFHGVQRFAKLGRVGDLSLAAARDKAAEFLVEITKHGRDPQAEEAKKRAAAVRDKSTVATMVADFIDTAKTRGGRPRAASTANEYKRLLRANIASAPLGRVPLGKATTDDVERFLESVKDRAPVVANRLAQLLRVSFSWAIKKSMLVVNPCAAINDPAPEAEREGTRVLSDAEIRLLWTALDAKDDGARLVSPRLAVAVRVMVLLGTRRGETLRARWQDLQPVESRYEIPRVREAVEAGLWLIPAQFRKGGEELEKPLPPRVAKLFESIRPAGVEEGWIFTGRDGGCLAKNAGRVGAEVRHAYQAACAAAGFKSEPWSFHDLRRTAATGVGGLGAPPHVVALVLGHSALPGHGAVTAVYDRSRRAGEVAAWLELWSNHVAQLVANITEAEPKKRPARA